MTSVVKIIELISEGNSIEAAVNSAVEEAAKTLHNIKQVNISHIEGIVENNKVTKYRTNVKISFLVDKR